MAAAVAIDAFLVEPVRIQISRHQVAIPGLPEAWRGARVVHLSDLHYGDPRSERLFRWMVRTVNALEPDLILITGDFIVRHPEEVAPAVAYVGQLRAQHGVVAILGDHDFQIFTRHPVGGIDSALQNAGLRLLRNDALTLPGGLRIAGIDPVTHKVRCGDLEAALRAEPNPHLLLSHSPDILPEAAAQGVDLVLAGHTHGGQVVVPFYGPPITHTHIGRKHASGWSQYQGTRLFVCRGLASHYSLRFFCPPEVALFELTDAG
jgi:predicted MPP superfamily phosphohydrolase